MPQTVIFFAALIALLVIAVYYSKYRMKKAIGDVISIMRRFNALDEGSAKTQADLGLAPPSLLARMISVKDYKPQAVQILMGHYILQMTDDGRIYLSEANLASTNLAGLVTPPA